MQAERDLVGDFADLLRDLKKALIAGALSKADATTLATALCAALHVSTRDQLKEAARMLFISCCDKHAGPLIMRLNNALAEAMGVPGMQSEEKAHVA